MIRYSQGESGIALVAVMIVILLLTVLGAGLLSSALLENKIVHRVEDQKQAFYLAQAGIEYSKFRLQKDLTWRTNGETQTLANGQFRLTVVNDGENQLRIRSTGTVGKASKTLEVGVHYTQGQPIIEELAKYEVLGGGSIKFDNNVGLYNGDLRSNQNISFGHNVYSEGQLIAGGDVTGSLPTGSDIEENASAFPIPTVDWEGLRDEAMESGRYLTFWDTRLFRSDVVNYVDGTGLPGHNVWVSKKDDHLYLDGVLVIHGNLVFEQSSDVIIASTKGLMVFVDGNVTFQNNVNIAAAIFATGNIYFENNVNINGAVYARGAVEFENNVNIVLDAKHLAIPSVEEAIISSGTGDESRDSMTFTFWNEE